MLKLTLKLKLPHGCKLAAEADAELMLKLVLNKAGAELEAELILPHSRTMLLLS